MHDQRPDYFRQDRSEMLRFIPSEARTLLEVGCGEGRFLDAFQVDRPGSEGHGIELNANAAALGQQRGLSIATGSFPDAAPDDLTYDCVLFNDVLEHIEDPWNALDRTKGLLSPGGCVVACIPNICSLDVIREIVVDGDFRYQAAGVLDVTHLRFFTMTSARRMFEDRGFHVERIIGLKRRRPTRRQLGLYMLLSLRSRRFRHESMYRQFVVVARQA